MNQSKEQPIADLLKPRIKIIAPWPYMPKHRKVGDIIEVDANKLLWWKKFNTVVVELNWYEDREESEMPEYVKDKDGVYKIKNFHRTNQCNVFEIYDFEALKRGAGWSIFIKDRLKSFDPATDHEYNQYINQKP